MSKTRAIKVESCWNCPNYGPCFFGLRIISERGIPIKCPLPKWPSLDKSKIIQIQKILLAVSEKETGVIIAMAKIDGIFCELGVSIEEEK